MTKVQPNDWKAISQLVEERLQLCGLAANLSNLARLSGVSDATWRALLRGSRLARRDKRQAIARTLHWPDQAFDWLEEGIDPQDWGEPPTAKFIVTMTDPADIESVRLTENPQWAMQQRIADLEARVRTDDLSRRPELAEIRAEVDELKKMIRALRTEVEQSRSSGPA